jgi:hypothetical protein
LCTRQLLRNKEGTIKDQPQPVFVMIEK